MKKEMGQMELIDRYIYDVTRRLPEKQRGDIARELHSLIDDMLAQQEEASAGMPEENRVTAVLQQLGDPSEMAAQYSGRPRYLIGPALFDTYLLVLRIAIVAAAFGLVVALAVNYSLNPTTPDVTVDSIVNTVVSGVVSAATGAFCWVTIVFALIEYFAPDKFGKRRNKKPWSPADLPELTDERLTMRKSGPVVAMLFVVLFWVLLHAAPQLFGVYLSTPAGHEGHFVPIFSLAAFRTRLPLMDICLAVCFLQQVIRLVFHRYSLRFAAVYLVLSTAGLIFALLFFAAPGIWNDAMLAAVRTASGPFVADAAFCSRAMSGLLLLIYGLQLVGTLLKCTRLRLRGSLKGLKNI